MSATISPALAALIDRWHAIGAERDGKLAEAKPRLAGADFETKDRETSAIIGPTADAEVAVEMEIAAYPAQSLADIAAKCAFSRKADPDNYDLAFAMVEAVAADAERLAKG